MEVGHLSGADKLRCQRHPWTSQHGHFVKMSRRSAIAFEFFVQVEDDCPFWVGDFLSLGTNKSPGCFCWQNISWFKDGPMGSLCTKCSMAYQTRWFTIWEAFVDAFACFSLLWLQLRQLTLRSSKCFSSRTPCKAMFPGICFRLNFWPVSSSFSFVAFWKQVIQIISNYVIPPGLFHFSWRKQSMFEKPRTGRLALTIWRTSLTSVALRFRASHRLWRCCCARKTWIARHEYRDVLTWRILRMSMPFS